MLQFVVHLNLQNENVDRPHTSESVVRDLRRPDRRTPMKALVAKKFTFVTAVWDRYIHRNKVDLRFTTMNNTCRHAFNVCCLLGQ